MSRERERIVAKIEKNPVVECNKVQRKFYQELFSKFMNLYCFMDSDAKVLGKWLVLVDGSELDEGYQQKMGII